MAGRVGPRTALLGALLCTYGCGGPQAVGDGGAGAAARRVVAPPPAVVNHLSAVVDVVESPPAGAQAAWSRLGPAQAEVAAVFYPGWSAERQTAAMDAAWAAWGTRWADVRTGLYRLENVLDRAVAAAARDFGKAMGTLPRATVHLYFVPDRRAGAAAVVGGRGHIGLNAGALALREEAALERETLRQFAALHALGRGDLPGSATGGTLAARLYLEGLGAWAVRAVRPATPEGEAIGADAADLASAQARLRDVGARIAGALDSADGGLGDALLVHGAGDGATAAAGRLAAYGLMRAIARDDLPEQVLAMPFATFRARAGEFWAGGAGSGPAGATTAAGGLVEERSAEEVAALERGGKTAECVGEFVDGGGAAAPLPVPGGGWVRRGGRVDAALGAGPVTLGLIADIKQADEDTVRNLRGFVEEFRRAAIGALLVAGDVSETAQGVKGALEVLAGVGVPVLVIPGNRESTGRYRSAIGEVTAAHGNVIDMAEVRLVDAQRFAVVSLPGYYDARYVHARDGCLYRPEHVAALAGIASRAKARPLILLAHSPPRAEGPGAIDFADAGANVGDPDMTRLLRAGKAFDAGVYANLHEAGGRAVRGDLKTRVAPGSWVSDIHLVTGSANAMPWPMLDGRVNNGMAGLLDIDGAGRLRYRILMAPAP